jgi:hypothetical protein
MEHECLKGTIPLAVGFERAGVSPPNYDLVAEPSGFERV